MRINNKGKIILGLLSFFLITPLVVFYVLDGAGVFDTRSRAGTTEELPEALKKADLNGDNKITISDFGIWLSSYRDYKANPAAFAARADLNSDGAITIMDFSLWLNAYREFKGTNEPGDGGDLAGLVNYNWGNGSDGDFVVSGNVDIDAQTEKCTVGGFAPSYNVMSFASDGKSATVDSTPGTCLKAGDEVLVINVQGGGTYDNVGNHEILKIDSVTGSTVKFTAAKVKFYGSSSGTDAGIGKGCGSQVVVMQRIPQFKNVTINADKTLSAKAWNGDKGGIVVFKASGTVNINGSISVTADGFRGGLKNNTSGSSGEGMSSCSVASGIANFGGAAVGAFGGAYATRVDGTGPGLVYGVADLSKLYLGSGGSSVKRSGDRLSRAGGAGGGLVFILANDINVNGTINATGANGTVRNSTTQPRGAGSGGSVKLVGDNVVLGTNKILVNGGTTYGLGGTGRIAVYYSSVISGSTTPSFYSKQFPK